MLATANQVAKAAKPSTKWPLQNSTSSNCGSVFVPIKVPKKGLPLTSMNTTAWQNARVRAADKWKEQAGNEAADGFRRVRVHDLKHTFGRRLRAAGVSFEDRQDLLGHKSGRITTHYSSAELTSLIAAAEKVCDEKSHNPPRNHLATETIGTREPRQAVVVVGEVGAPGEIRTPDHLVRSQVLYPAELRARRNL